MKEINMDEMMGFILRRANEEDIIVDYGDVEAIFEFEEEFLDSKGLVGEDDLSDYETCELVEELKDRDGVTYNKVTGGYSIEAKI